MSPDAREPSLIQLCVVRVGAESYAIDLKRVDEILPVPAITTVPRSPSFLEGVARLRGEVLPIIDARKRLAVTPSGATALTPSGKPKRTERLVVCRVGTRRLGLLVDAVTNVRRVLRSSLKPAPMVATPGKTPHVLGVAGDDTQVVLLLDVKAFLEES